MPDEDPGQSQIQSARGKYVQSLPETGQNQSSDPKDQLPTAEYKVQLSKAGNYRLWLRWTGYDGSSDSIYAWMKEVASPGWYRYADGGNPDDGDFATKVSGEGEGWDGIAGPEGTSGGGGEMPAIFAIPAPGTYTIVIGQREDGSALDALIFQLDNLPAPTNPGPPESPRADAAPQPLTVSLLPAPDSKGAAFDKGISAIFVDGTTKLAANSAVLELDGATVAATAKKEGDITTVSFVPATFFAPNSVHKAKVSYKDDKAASFSEEWSFTVRDYALLTANLKVTPDTSKRGFLWRVHQNNEAGQGNSNSRTERQLSGEIKDASGNPIANLADPSAVGGADAPAKAPNPAWAPITFEVSKVINFDQAAGNRGAFTPDEQMPGIPGTDGSMDSIAAEIITYLELPAGLIRMGVNSDDGFKATVGLSTDIFDPPITVGEFNGGRGAADTLFTFVVAEAGVYPFRTTWEEGGGDANIEWFTFKPGTNTKVLVNDDANGGVKAYRAIQPTEKKAFARKVQPAPGSGGAEATPQIRVELVDGSTPIDQATVKLKLDGASVSANVAKAADVTTVTFKPATAFPLKSKHTAELSYTEKGSVITRTWEFTTLNTDLLAYWDFNDASDPTRAVDKVGKYVGTFGAGAKYTDNGKGRTGKTGDRAAKVGSMDPVVNGIIRVSGAANVSFMNAGGIQNQLAISMWQRLDETRNSSAFWATGVGQDRAFQAHVPWGDNVIYFDTGGGCCDGTQRINANIDTFSGFSGDSAAFFGAWRHFVFQKNGDKKQVWIDGKLFLEGNNSSPLPFVFNLLAIGADSGGGNNTHGDLDDFAVFASALTPDEIGKLFAGTPPDQVRPVTVVAEQPKFTKFTKNADGSITIEWTGGGTLQAAASVTGPWQDVPGATSPYNVKPAPGALFGRIKK